MKLIHAYGLQLLGTMLIVAGVFAEMKIKHQDKVWEDANNTTVGTVPDAGSVSNGSHPADHSAKSSRLADNT